MSIYKFNVKTIDQKEISLSEYQGKVLLIVNTASECGLASQLEGLQELHQNYQDKGFSVLGFPSNQFMNQEPLEGQEIAAFCATQYGVEFPLFDKIMVNGETAHPLYHYLVNETKGKKIKWNYTKFLIGRDGEIIERFGSLTTPEKIEDSIVEALSTSV
ncbi:glutathione peroxidase [Desemzia sp. RIT804]|uniref:glutathione peroxidase n=1 Tax=Desemzia sp. RIT 804 TaxID=2810209 RepID=UPI00194FC074|nr:glutathione peroxidase [Desemzia sp. RIT 804]MBM6615712.1 glutathione peroxidase [Desemzia sp. RIT 804]